MKKTLSQSTRDAHNEIIRLKNVNAELLEENIKLRAMLLHGEAFDDTDWVFEHGEDRTWNVLTSKQKQYWQDIAKEK